MQVRRKVRNFLESFDLYLKIRYSDFYLKKIQKKHASVSVILKKEKAYYLSLLENIKESKRIVFDVGANEGFISYFFLEENFRVIGIEPDKRNQKILLTRFKNQKRFKLLKKGVSDKERIAPFFIHNRNSSLNTFSTKWKESIESKNQDDGFSTQQEFMELTTLDQIIKEEGVPAFIKIDVEGHELEVFKGLNIKIPLLSFEANFPEFKEETFLILEKLIKIDEDCEFDFSINYQLELSDFVSMKQLKKLLAKIEGEVCIEILCKMSNYPMFFEEL
jgi:FkbM family methyltransferase